MTATLNSVVFDVADVAKLADFYGSLTGWPVDGDETWIDITTPNGVRVCLQPAPDHVPPRWPDPDHPQQLHIDLLVPDVEAAAARAVGLGATRLATVDTGTSVWVTLADPAGHPFDLCRREGAGDGVAAPMGYYGVCLDTEDAATLSRFYAQLLGLSLTWEGEEGALLGGDGPTIYFQKVARHVRPQWPDPAHPQQGHLDIEASDADAVERQVLAAGAVKLPGGGRDVDESGQARGWRVYADPSGHPFCLVFDA